MVEGKKGFVSWRLQASVASSSRPPLRGIKFHPDGGDFTSHGVCCAQFAALISTKPSHRKIEVTCVGVSVGGSEPEEERGE